MQIESLSNKQIKQAAALKQKKYRDESGLFLAEGLRNAQDILLNHPELVLNIFITENVRQHTENSFWLAGFSLSIVSELIINKLTDTSSTQGIVVVCKKPPLLPLNSSILFLDRIRDPGNLGTIFRTASAAGYSLILNDCADIFSPKCVRSCMGSILSTSFRYGNIDSLNELKSQGYNILAADKSGKNMYSFQQTEKLCVVIGNEANGISSDIMNICHDIISIPMQQNESLNAAISAAILMYQLKKVEE